MTRHYRDRTKHQNGASITSGSLSLTAGALLQGQGLSGASFPYTVAVYAQDTSGNLTSYEEMDVTGGTYPTLTVTRGINGTNAVAHDTTHIIAQVVGTNDMDNVVQKDGAQQTGTINLTGKVQALFHQGAAVALTYAATISLDPTLGELFTTTTTSGVGNATINAASAGVPGQRFYLQITNDAVLGRTITFGTNMTSNGTLVGTTTKTAVLLFESDGTGWFEVARGTGLGSVDIGSDSANIAKVNLTDQGGAPAVPAAGHHIIYSKSGGIYMEDHSGAETLISSGGGMVQLASTVLGSNTASVSFASIPGTYSALLIEYVARSTSAGSALDTMLCRFNSDTGGDYDYQNGSDNGSITSASETFGATSIRCGLCVQNGAASGLAAAGSILIPEYAGTSFNKTLNAVCSSKIGTATQNMRNERNAGFWRSSSAITQIDLLPGAGSFLAGSKFRLYGIV